MKRKYLYKQATYNVVLRNFQDEFLRNMFFNLYKNGTISLSNSKDFFDEGVSTEDENKAILVDIYNLLIKPENRTIEFLKEGEIENVTVDLNITKQDDNVNTEKQEENANVEKQEVEKKPLKKRGRPKGSKNKV